MKWNEAATSIGGLLALATLMAHFLLPALPLTALRVNTLLFLIGVCLFGDRFAEAFAPGWWPAPPDDSNGG